MKQGGTAKLRLSPLHKGAGAFLFSARGGGCVESDLIDLGDKNINLETTIKFGSSPTASRQVMNPPIGRNYERQS